MDVTPSPAHGRGALWQVAKSPEVAALLPVDHEICCALRLREEYVSRLRRATMDLAHHSLFEVGNLLDMVRLCTLEVVEAVTRWREATGHTDVPWPDGNNALLSMMHDLDFLQEVPSMVTWIPFSLCRNPFLLPSDMTQVPKSAATNYVWLLPQFHQLERMVQCTKVLVAEELYYGAQVPPTDADFRLELPSKVEELEQWGVELSAPAPPSPASRVPDPTPVPPMWGVPQPMAPIKGRHGGVHPLQASVRPVKARRTSPLRAGKPVLPAGDVGPTASIRNDYVGLQPQRHSNTRKPKPDTADKVSRAYGPQNTKPAASKEPPMSVAALLKLQARCAQQSLAIVRERLAWWNDNIAMALAYCKHQRSMSSAETFVHGLQDTWPGKRSILNSLTNTEDNAAMIQSLMQEMPDDWPTVLGMRPAPADWPHPLCVSPSTEVLTRLRFGGWVAAQVTLRESQLHAVQAMLNDIKQREMEGTDAALQAHVKRLKKAEEQARARMYKYQVAAKAGGTKRANPAHLYELVGGFGTGQLAFMPTASTILLGEGEAKEAAAPAADEAEPATTQRPVVVVQEDPLDQFVKESLAKLAHVEGDERDELSQQRMFIKVAAEVSRRIVTLLAKKKGLLQRVVNTLRAPPHVVELCVKCTLLVMAGSDQPAVSWSKSEAAKEAGRKALRLAPSWQTCVRLVSDLRFLGLWMPVRTEAAIRTCEAELQRVDEQGMPMQEETRSAVANAWVMEPARAAAVEGYLADPEMQPTNQALKGSSSHIPKLLLLWLRCMTGLHQLCGALRGEGRPQVAYGPPPPSSPALAFDFVPTTGLSPSWHESLDVELLWSAMREGHVQEQVVPKLADHAARNELAAVQCRSVETGLVHSAVCDRRLTQTCSALAPVWIDAELRQVQAEISAVWRALETPTLVVLAGTIHPQHKQCAIRALQGCGSLIRLVVRPTEDATQASSEYIVQDVASGQQSIVLSATEAVTLCLSMSKTALTVVDIQHLNDTTRPSAVLQSRSAEASICTAVNELLSGSMYSGWKRCMVTQNTRTTDTLELGEVARDADARLRFGARIDGLLYAVTVCWKWEPSQSPVAIVQQHVEALVHIQLAPVQTGQQRNLSCVANPGIVAALQGCAGGVAPWHVRQAVQEWVAGVCRQRPDDARERGWSALVRSSSTGTFLDVWKGLGWPHTLVLGACNEQELMQGWWKQCMPPRQVHLGLQNLAYQRASRWQGRPWFMRLVRQGTGLEVQLTAEDGQVCNAMIGQYEHGASMVASGCSAGLNQVLCLKSWQELRDRAVRNAEPSPYDLFAAAASMRAANEAAHSHREALLTPSGGAVLLSHRPLDGRYSMCSFTAVSQLQVLLPSRLVQGACAAKTCVARVCTGLQSNDSAAAMRGVLEACSGSSKAEVEWEALATSRMEYDGVISTFVQGARGSGEGASMFLLTAARGTDTTHLGVCVTEQPQPQAQAQARAGAEPEPDSDPGSGLSLQRIFEEQVAPCVVLCFQPLCWLVARSGQ